jgi:hypothetical protein
VSKVTLDIICETAFGYKADSLHDPHNPLANAYEDLLSLQSGKFDCCYQTTEHHPVLIPFYIQGANISLFILIFSIPGVKSLFASEWMYNHHRWLRKIPALGTCNCPYPITVLMLYALASSSVLVDSMYRIRKFSEQLLKDKMREASTVYSSDDVAKKDIMSLLVRARMNEKGDGYQMSDDAMVQQVVS